MRPTTGAMLAIASSAILIVPWTGAFADAVRQSEQTVSSGSPQPETVGDGRIYVRRIEFLGTDRVDDGVLRREFDQLEGSYINTTALERSRMRLERLPYVESARITQRPVPGSPDQVDLLTTIVEAPAREYRFGGSYSESLRLSGYGYFVNHNLLGSGQRLFARVDVSELRTLAQISHTEPYAFGKRISRTIGIRHRDVDRLTADTSEFDANISQASLEYGYRIGELQSIRAGLSLQDTDISAGSLASNQLNAWIRGNGDATETAGGVSTEYLGADILFGWQRDSRDRNVFPNSGSEQRISVNLAVPGSEVEYYSVDYDLSKYWSFSGWTAAVGAKLGYGGKYGSTTALPPTQNWFAGGPRSVRGYRENGLGPRDSLGNPYGGNLLATAQLELMMPLPEKWRRFTRIGLFYDIGNVFSTEDVEFLDDNGQNVDYGFAFSELRQSIGIAAQVRLPIGLLRVSYGVPLNAEDNNANRFLRDDVNRFQVAFGVDF